jgi:hypothetical protein
MPRRLMIDLPVRKDWSNVELLRTVVFNCFTVMFQDADRGQAVATVTSELMENAIKYGSAGDGEAIPIQLTVVGDPAGAQVTVEHPVDPDGPEVATLMEMLAWIATRSSAADAYQERLAAFAENPPTDGGSKLGLVRIAYEGNCRLTANVVGRRLTVSAETLQ